LSSPRYHIAILGSTGSIGVNTLRVVREFPERFTVLGLAGGRNVERLSEQIQMFRPRLAAVRDESLATELKGRLGHGHETRVLWGREGYIELASMPQADTVVSAMVGAAGLLPTWAAVQAGKRVALANKETLVMAGELVMAEAARTGARILPVDSEHSAIFQSLAGQRIQDVRRIILTASGGPFRDMPPEELAHVSREQALAHPNWDMGAKISIDSATLMNKGLEAIEAKWLFDLPWSKIAIHIHPQSIVHSMVEFIDGSVIAQLGVPDMRVPIALALSHPERLPLGLPPLDLPRTNALTFSEPDLDRFPCLDVALRTGRLGGTGPAVLNAANEEAVASFLAGELGFLDIAEVVRRVATANGTEPLRDLDQVMAADRTARTRARAEVAEIKEKTRTC